MWLCRLCCGFLYGGLGCRAGDCFDFDSSFFFFSSLLCLVVVVMHTWSEICACLGSSFLYSLVLSVVPSFSRSFVRSFLPSLVPSFPLTFFPLLVCSILPSFPPSFSYIITHSSASTSPLPSSSLPGVIENDDICTCTFVWWG